MDSLKSLMDRKEYELVIKLTNDTQDITYLFYRITSFLALGKGEEALSVIENNRKILENDLPLLMKIHIEILCLLNNFDKAYEEVRYYESLPYQSQRAEEMLKELPKMIRLEEKNSLANKEMPNDKLKQRLMSDDVEVVLPAIDMVRDRDINMFLKELEHIMLHFEKQSIRSFALLLCVQKQLNKEIQFNHLGQVITVNPSKLEPPFIGDEFNSFLRYMDSEFRDPAVNEDAVHILSSYIIYMYPEKLNINYGILLESLRSISYEYLRINDDKDLKQHCEDKNVPLEEVTKLIQRIKEALENF